MLLFLQFILLLSVRERLEAVWPYFCQDDHRQAAAGRVKADTQLLDSVQSSNTDFFSHSNLWWQPLLGCACPCALGCCPALQSETLILSSYFFSTSTVYLLVRRHVAPVLACLYAEFSLVERPIRAAKRWKVTSNQHKDDTKRAQNDHKETHTDHRVTKQQQI